MKKIDKRLWIPMLIHVLVIFLVMGWTISATRHRSIWDVLARIPTIPLIYQFMAIPIVDLVYWHVFRKRSFPKGVGVALLVALVYQSLEYLISAIYSGQWLLGSGSVATDIVIIVGSELLGTLYGALYIIVYAAIRLYIRYLLREKDVKIQQTESELDALKAQLNPHFFFNSLNHLYGTALAEKAGRTSQSVITLSDMMRYTIAKANLNFVPLGDELKFINNYIYLQKIRLPDKESIDIKVSIDNYEGSYCIAPMLLLPFIENAFKYGISVDDPCFIYIDIHVADDKITMEVKNSIAGDPNILGNNTGLANTRKRLELLYQNKYQLDIKAENSTYFVHLAVNAEIPA